MSIAPGNVQYNYAQLEGIWIQAGGSAGAAPIAAAIAMAESGGNSTATNNDSNGSTDRGLWQVNSVHGSQSTYDVMGNARAAVAISSNGTNWSPWTTYSSGAYRRYLQTNVPPNTQAPINGTNAQVNQNTANLTGFDLNPLNPSLPGGLKDPLNWFLNPLGSAEGAVAGGVTQPIAGQIGGTLIKYALQGMITTVLNPMIQVMAGVLGMTAGGVMILVGVWVAARSTDTGQAAERGAGQAAQAGISLLGPEAAATTRYMGASGQATTVTSIRRPPGSVRLGGRRIQYRPGQVRTQVDRTGGATYGDTYQGPGERPPPPPRSTRDQLNGEANGYNGRRR